jgi:ABC-type enterochelin transport system permease subunit
MVSPLGLGLFVIDVGLWIGGLSLIGLADLKTACRQIFLVGIINAILTAWLLSMHDYLSACIIGFAGCYNFLQAGLIGFMEGTDAKTVGKVLSFVGIFVIIMGFYLVSLKAIWTGIYAIIAGIVLQFYLAATHGKATKTCGWIIVILMLIDTALSFPITWELIV